MKICEICHQPMIDCRCSTCHTCGKVGEITCLEYHECRMSNIAVTFNQPLAAYLLDFHRDIKEAHRWNRRQKPVCAAKCAASFTECPICEGYGVLLNAAGEINECQNCGGQKMYGVGTGLTRKRANGDACVHEYIETQAITTTKTYAKYVCMHCADFYYIDSGD